RRAARAIDGGAPRRAPARRRLAPGGNPSLVPDVAPRRGLRCGGAPPLPGVRPLRGVPSAAAGVARPLHRLASQDRSATGPRPHRSSPPSPLPLSPGRGEGFRRVWLILRRAPWSSAPTTARRRQPLTRRNFWRERSSRGGSSFEPVLVHETSDT